jgi:hypothetical protein
VEVDCKVNEVIDAAIVAGALYMVFLQLLAGNIWKVGALGDLLAK